MSALDRVITSRQRDIGGFFVRRLLPFAARRMVGPFIFFDHMGPANFSPGKGMDVRPHPHIGLSTVTYLFEGVIQHKDSLGYDQPIEPGAINWMTAGRGVVHSERSPEAQRLTGGPLHGIQLWVALPEAFEEGSPSFHHHPASTLPRWKEGGVDLTLLLGKAFGHESPVKVHSPLIYLEAQMPKGSRLHFPTHGMESAAYVVEGSVLLNGQQLSAYEMGIPEPQEDLQLEAAADSRVMLIAGAPLGERFIDWNFVSSSKERLAEARAEWAAFGPRKESTRFRPVPGDDKEFIPL